MLPEIVTCPPGLASVVKTGKLSEPYELLDENKIVPMLVNTGALSDVSKLLLPIFNVPAIVASAGSEMVVKFLQFWISKRLPILFNAGKEKVVLIISLIEMLSAVVRTGKEIDVNELSPCNVSMPDKDASEGNEREAKALSPPNCKVLALLKAEKLIKVHFLL